MVKEAQKGSSTFIILFCQKDIIPACLLKIFISVYGIFRKKWFFGRVFHLAILLLIKYLFQSFLKDSQFY